MIRGPRAVVQRKGPCHPWWPLTGSICSAVPVVTVEMAVITQPDDEAFIASPEGQDRMSRALFTGLEAYFQSG